MQAVDPLKKKILLMITEEKEALSAYKGLCAKYQITPDPIPEAVAQAKVQALETILKSLHT